MERLDLIITSKNNVDELVECLKNVNSIINPYDFKTFVTVIDDHSSKDQKENFLTNVIKFKTMFSNIEVNPLLMSKSQGFIKCLNQGISYSLNKKYTSKYIGFLHDDVKLYKGWAEDLTSFLKNNKNLFCVSSISEKTDSEEIVFDKLNLFSCIFTFDSMKKIKCFDEIVCSPVDIEISIAEKIKSLKGKCALNPKFVVEHKGNFTNKDEYQNEKEAVEFFREFKQSLNNKKKNVIYSFSNDEVVELEDLDPSYDYILFTTNKDIQSKTWRIVDASKIVKLLKSENYSLIKDYFKINPHLFFGNKEKSIWIDFSLIKEFNFKKYAELENLMKTNWMLSLQNTNFDCLYKFLHYLKLTKTISVNEFNSILSIYKWYHFPLDAGVIDSSLLVRNHNDKHCVMIMEKVWGLCKKYSATSDLFLNLELWLNKMNYSYISNSIFKRFNRGLK